MPAPVPPISRATIPPVYARQLRMLLQQAAPDGDRALAAAQLDWSTLLTDPNHLPLETVTPLVTSAIAITHKPWLGLDLAANFPITAHGPQGYAVVTAPDLASSLSVLVKYGALRNELLTWSLQTSPQGMVAQARSQTDLGLATGFITDMVLGAVLRLIESALGQLPDGMIVDMPMPAPRWLAQYERYAPVQIRFGQPVLAFHVSHALLRLPCLAADPQAHAAALRECESSLAESANRRLSDRVARLLSTPTDGRYLQLDEIAALCQLSPRTLMRRLSEENTSFKALLDASRQSQALWLLHHTDHSVEDIAAQLGYQDTSNFSRTVRRWFGATPRQLRDNKANFKEAA